MDVLSQVLLLLKISQCRGTGLDAGGDWSIHFQSFEGIKFNAVLKGQCWVTTQDQEEPYLVEAGDCILLSRGEPFIAATDLSMAPINSSLVYQDRSKKVAIWNGGGDFLLVGFSFKFTGDIWQMLTNALPAFILLKNASHQVSVLNWAIAQLSIELKEESLGGELMTNHLAQMMLLQVLRVWLGPEQIRYKGWLAALADHRLLRSMNAIHAQPNYSWSVAELAAEAGMSRTSFATHFENVVGQSPIRYLTYWRMLLAADLLINGDEKISTIAYSVGYQSEAAFSTAFKRLYNSAPSDYRVKKRTTVV